jgi:diguanylate cyclase (GGDEF)-like protein
MFYDQESRLEMQKTVLIVDDQIELLEILNSYLESYNFKVLMTTNGTDAIDIIASDKHIDVVILDIMMPMENGIDITKTIRNMELDYYLPIIILTAKTELNDIIEGLDAGADDYIKKPYDLLEVHARINSVIHRSELYADIFSQKYFQNNPKLIYKRRGKVEEKLQKEIHYLRSLYEMSHELYSNLDYDKLLDNTLFSLISHLGSKNASIMLRSAQDRDFFEPIMTKGLLTREFEKIGFVVDQGMLQYFTTNKFLNFNDVTTHLPFYFFLKPLLNLSIELMVPLWIDNKIEGFILLGERIKEQEYKKDEIDILSLYTNAVSVALNNSLRHEYVKKMSYTDAKTQLYNDRYMNVRLAEEYSRSERINMPLSVMIVDIDFFKNYNDTFGHLAGDNALKKVASVLRAAAREEDVVCRYGGEEFCVILPNTPAKAAKSVAERFRKSIERTKFYKEEVQPNGQLTCSFGVATIPTDAQDQRDVVDKADKALYYSKHHGRNIVTAFSEFVEEII